MKKDKNKVPLLVEVEVYYTKKGKRIVIDTEAMQEEFERQVGWLIRSVNE